MQELNCANKIVHFKIQNYSCQQLNNISLHKQGGLSKIPS